MCSVCQKADVGTRPSRCQHHRQLKANVLKGGDSPMTVAPAERVVTRRTELASTSSSVAAPVEIAGAAVDSEQPARLELASLPLTSPERVVAEDGSLALLILTANAYGSSTPRGMLLKSCIVKRGVRRILYDEVDTVHSLSWASFSAELAHLGATTLRLVHRQAQHGHPAPQVVGFSATLPPSWRGEVLHRLCLQRNLSVHRHSVDRPELAFHRLVLPSGARTESIPSAALRGVRMVCSAIPSWAAAGKGIVFVNTTAQARKLAALVNKDNKDNVRDGLCRPAWAYYSKGSSPAARVAALESFQVGADGHPGVPAW